MATSGKWHRLVFLTGSVCFPPTIVASVTGLYPRCADQLHSRDSTYTTVASSTHFSVTFVYFPALNSSVLHANYFAILCWQSDLVISQFWHTARKTVWNNTINATAECCCLGCDAIWSITSVPTFPKTLLQPLPALMMEAAGSPETSISVHDVTWDIRQKHTHCRDNLKSHDKRQCWAATGKFCPAKSWFIISPCKVPMSLPELSTLVFHSTHLFHALKCSVFNSACAKQSMRPH
jgi:hypothetical protein